MDKVMLGHEILPYLFSDLEGECGEEPKVHFV